MKCHECSHHDSKVIESRDLEDAATIRRRRQCLGCGARFTTYERVESIQLLVIKSHGGREPYSREKLMTGIVTACRKTAVSAEQIAEMLDGLELELQILGKREIPSSQLGELVLSRLRLLNEVAYVRFASVYRQFQSVEDFIRVLNQLADERSLSSTMD